jgi:predicted DNA-binding protein (UPF0251 family)
MGLKQALEFMVARRLANNNEELEVLRLALVENVSPSEVARRLGVSKPLVRTTVYTFGKAVGDPYKAAKVVEMFLPMVMEIQPIVKTFYGKEYLCTVCGLKGVANVSIFKARLMHVKMSHKDLVSKYVDEILMKVGAYEG